MEEKQNNLYIPANITIRLELYKGYGIKDLVTTILVVAFLLPIILLIYKLKCILLAVICLLVITAGTIIAITKDDNNFCVVDQIKFMFKSIEKWAKS